MECSNTLSGLNSSVTGYDISVIAYGQSGAGKTYTILGPGVHCALSETEYGIIPRVTREIFSRLTVSVISS